MGFPDWGLSFPIWEIGLAVWSLPYFLPGLGSLGGGGRAAFLYIIRPGSNLSHPAPWGLGSAWLASPYFPPPPPLVQPSLNPALWGRFACFQSTDFFFSWKGIYKEAWVSLLTQEPRQVFEQKVL